MYRLKLFNLIQHYVISITSIPFLLNKKENLSIEIKNNLVITYNVIGDVFK